jgi:alpha-D-xyloside xylohydrolase
VAVEALRAETRKQLKTIITMMKRNSLNNFMRCLAMGVLALWAVQTSAQGWQKTANGAKANVGNCTIDLQFFDNATVRVLKIPAGGAALAKSLVVTATPQKVGLRVNELGSTLQLKSSALTVQLDLQSGQVSFATPKGEKLLAENGKAVFEPIVDGGKKAFAARQDFTLDSDEPIYGFGQPQNGSLSQRHVNRLLQPQNVGDGIPCFVSLKGYGLYWDNYSGTNFNDDANGTYLRSEVADAVDYYFMYGGDLDGAVAQMRKLTGDVPMFPLWTYGFWQSRERYKSSAELEEVVTKYRQLGIPLDGIVQDWQYWGTHYLWNAMDFLNESFADGKQMIDSVHHMNAHIIFTIWSSFGPMTMQYREMEPKNMLLHFKTWPESGLPFWPPRKDYPSGVRVYDAFNPEARDIYWKHLRRMYDYGTDGYWMDSTEPDMFDVSDSTLNEMTYMGTLRRMRCAYPLMTVGGVYDHQRAVTSDRRMFILTRSCFAGQQRYGCNVWSGDIASTWESMRQQIPAGLNFTLTGNPNYNCDLGGFFAGAYNKSWNDNSACNNPAYRELYARWIQCGVFYPMMRSHGTEVYREFYYYGKAGEPIYDALVGAVKTRYSLLPYIYSTSWQVTHNRGSFMRALPMDFPKDKRVWNATEQFMFGKEILAAPVLHSQYTPEVAKKVSAEEGWNSNSGAQSVSDLKDVDFTAKKSTKVYLPAGTQWYDYWTGQRLDGGQEIEKSTTIATIPMYVRAGSILPIGPDVQYAAEKPWDNLTLRVYPGADGTFTLYEDEGDNYNYEHGSYSEIPMTWNNAKRVLTIGARRGSFKGMLVSRKFTVVLPDGKQRTVNYRGKAVRVKL